MTQQFTTPCYVRIEDAYKRKEICEQLEQVGYKLTVSAIYNRWGNFLVARKYGVIQNTGEKYGKLPEYLTDCGTNTELFLELAGMRSDTDKGQWFTDGEVWVKCDEDDFVDQISNFYARQRFDVQAIRKATSAEIVEHFKTK